MNGFKQQLLKDEQERYVDHRFSRALVIRLTGLHGAPLDSFMRIYRPTVEFVATTTDYEFQDYIKKCYSHYQQYMRLRKQLEGK